MLLGYRRVSSQDQVNGTSLAEQERVIRAIAMLQNLGPYDVVVYTDDAVSGSIPLGERPEGAKLMAAAKKGDTIVASKLDRCFRDALDALEVFKHCKDNGIDLIVYDFGPQSVTREGTVAKLMFTILAACAEMERARIHERAGAGRKAKKAMGGHIGGYAPYGFRKVGEGKGARLEPVPEEQDLVAQIRLARRQHDSLSATARHLAAIGVVNRVGKPFNKAQVARIMRAG